MEKSTQLEISSPWGVTRHLGRACREKHEEALPLCDCPVLQTRQSEPTTTERATIRRGHVPSKRSVQDVELGTLRSKASQVCFPALRPLVCVFFFL